MARVSLSLGKIILYWYLCEIRLGWRPGQRDAESSEEPTA